MNTTTLIYEIAAKALVDQRSVRKYLGKEPLRPLTEARIDAAVRELGHDPDALRLEYDERGDGK